MSTKKQDVNPDQDIEGTANVPARPVRLNGSKSQSVARSRSARRKKGTVDGGMHERCNKRQNW